MPSVRVPALLLAPLLLAACSRGPSRSAALAAIRAAQPSLERSSVRVQLWRDGPPWFSCAEVRAKFAGPLDTVAVRDQVGNWQPLLAAGWMTLRDTAAGPVADPGWCVADPTAAGEAAAARWTSAAGGAFPTGTTRRGWSVVVGHPVITMPESPRRIAPDTASATYLVTLAPNADGVATGADRDTARFVARLVMKDGSWRMTSRQPAPSIPARPAR